MILKMPILLYENGYDLDDLGLVWAAEHYQLGASLGQCL